MKKNLVILLLALFSFSTALIAHKTGVATNQSKDRTGSPVSQVQQCGQCHNNGNFSTNITMRLKDQLGNVVTEYLAGENYTFEVELNGTGSGYGFQAVALLANNVNAGNFTVNSSNAKIVTLNNRKYAEQVTRSTSGLFVMNWQAPSFGSGTTTFYSAGNCVNGNNTSSGDQSVTATPLVITESPLSSIEDDKEERIRVFPNPSTDYFYIEGMNGINYYLNVYDLNGKLIFSKIGSGNFFVETCNWKKGNYLVQFSGDISIVKTIIVQ